MAKDTTVVKRCEVVPKEKTWAQVGDVSNPFAPLHVPDVGDRGAPAISASNRIATEVPLRDPAVEGPLKRISMALCDRTPKMALEDWLVIEADMRAGGHVPASLSPARAAEFVLVRNEILDRMVTATTVDAWLEIMKPLHLRTFQTFNKDEHYPETPDNAHKAPRLIAAPALAVRAFYNVLGVIQGWLIASLPDCNIKGLKPEEYRARLHQIAGGHASVCNIDTSSFESSVTASDRHNFEAAPTLACMARVAHTHSFIKAMYQVIETVPTKFEVGPLTVTARPGVRASGEGVTSSGNWLISAGRAAHFIQRVEASLGQPAMDAHAAIEYIFKHGMYEGDDVTLGVRAELPEKLVHEIYGSMGAKVTSVQKPYCEFLRMNHSRHGTSDIITSRDRISSWYWIADARALKSENVAGALYYARAVANFQSEDTGLKAFGAIGCAAMARFKYAAQRAFYNPGTAIGHEFSYLKEFEDFELGDVDVASYLANPVGAPAELLGACELASKGSAYALDAINNLAIWASRAPGTYYGLRDTYNWSAFSPIAPDYLRKLTMPIRHHPAVAAAAVAAVAAAGVAAVGAVGLAAAAVAVPTLSLVGAAVAAVAHGGGFLDACGTVFRTAGIALGASGVILADLCSGHLSSLDGQAPEDEPPQVAPPDPGWGRAFYQDEVTGWEAQCGDALSCEELANGANSSFVCV